MKTSALGLTKIRDERIGLFLVFFFETLKVTSDRITWDSSFDKFTLKY